MISRSKRTLHKAYATVCLFAFAGCYRPTIALSIEEAVLRSTEHRKILQAGKTQVKEAQYIRKETLSGYAPNIWGTAYVNFAHEKKGIDNGLSLEAKQLIYSPSGPQVYYAMANDDYKIAQHALLQQQDMIRQQVEETFLRCWLLEQKERYLRACSHHDAQCLKDQRQRYASGIAGAAALRDAARAHTHHKQQCAIQDQELSLARGALAQAMGYEWYLHDMQPRLQWHPLSLPTLYSLQTYLHDAQIYRKELRIKDIEAARETKQSNLALREYLPNTYLVGSLAAIKPERTAYRHNKRKHNRIFHEQIGLRVEWKLFDGLSGLFRSRRARLRKQRSLLEKKDIRCTIALEIGKAYHQARATHHQLHLTRKHVHVQREHKQALQKKYAIGMASKQELYGAIKELYHAEYTWLEARVRYELAVKQLIYLCGYPPQHA